MKLYIGFAIGMVLGLVYLIWRNEVRVKRLGTLLLEVNNEPFKGSIIGICVLRIAIATLGVVLIGFFPNRSLAARILFLIFFGQMILSEVMTLLHLKRKTGIYQEGIYANTGARLYPEIQYFYETVKEKNLIYLISFSPKVFVLKQSRMYISEADRAKARKILSKKIEFDPDRKGIRKI